MNCQQKACNVHSAFLMCYLISLVPY